MAIYFDHKVDESAVGKVTTVQWHSAFPLLAVARYDDIGSAGCVHLHLEEGDRLPGCNLTNDCSANALAWHPSRKVLTAGWANGDITLWNESDQETYQLTKTHSAPVTMLLYNHQGNLMVSGDSIGTMAAWKTDTRGRSHHSPVYTLELEGQSDLTCVFRPVPESDSDTKISELAAKAVSGDPEALDKFDIYRNRKVGIPGSRTRPPNAEGLALFVGTGDGTVFHVDDKGKAEPVRNAEDPVRTFIPLSGAREELLVVTNTMVLSRFLVQPTGGLDQLLKVKLGGKSRDRLPAVVGLGGAVLATAAEEPMVRIWDLDADENYILTMDEKLGYNAKDIIVAMDYSLATNSLAAGTSSGTLVIWKNSAQSVSGDSSSQWKQLPAISTGGTTVDALHWGSNRGLLVAVAPAEGTIVYSEQLMRCSFCQGMSAVQTGPTDIMVSLFPSGNTVNVSTNDLQIKGVFCSKDGFVVWSGKQLMVFSLEAGVVSEQSCFATSTEVAALYEQTVFTTEPGKIQVRNVQGTVKNQVVLGEQEGDVVSLQVNCSSLVAGTDKGFLVCYDLGRRELRKLAASENLAQRVNNFSKLESVAIDCSGSKVSALVQRLGRPDPRLYVWDIETDTMQYFDFSTGTGSSEASSREDEHYDSLRSAVSGRVPTAHHWDPRDERLLVVEVEFAANVSASVVSFLVSAEAGMSISDVVPKEEVYVDLLGVQLPFLYFVCRAADVSPPGGVANKSQTVRRILGDFVGLDDGDDVQVRAVTDFSYYVALGNMDEAFKAIKLIKNESVWENMARMCVKSRRLDVAKVCLGNMGNARAARALREAEQEPEVEARVAILAIHLGMLEEAEDMLRRCRRFDLLNRLFQATGNWKEAIETAETGDRIHLKATYYNYAKDLEAVGNYQAAIRNYEKSNTHKFEVPRLLHDTPEELEKYAVQSNDKDVQRWWAKFLESSQDLEEALRYYQIAEDWLAMVRVYCYLGDMSKAAKIATDSKDRAACYHLARQHTNNGNTKEAVNFYSMARSYGNAIRLCTETVGMEDQLLNLAILGTKEDMEQAAKFYEQKQSTMDKAIMLYHKAGNISKAMELSFQAERFGALELIADDLDVNANPELLNRCAQFFLENKQYDRAVDLLVTAKRYKEAIELLVNHNITITEELAEKMTIPKEDDTVSKEMRKELLEKVGESCLRQGAYLLASKKFTQAGNRLNAMKALLRSGDTEKVIFFANVSRQREVYILAANYLQTQDWRADPEIMKNIITYYKKGKALDSLAGYYEACAQVEVDDFQNYDKALGALREAHKCLGEAKMASESEKERRVEAILAKTELVSRFLRVREVYSASPDSAIANLQEMLDVPDVNSSVRVGDMYGMMVEHFHTTGNDKQAYQTVEEAIRRIPTNNVLLYIDINTIGSIYGNLGLTIPTIVRAQSSAHTMAVEVVDQEGDDDGEEGFVEEAVDDEVDDGGF